MGKSTASKSTKTKEPEQSIEQPKAKSQKFKVLVSSFRFGDKIVSALGIPSKNAQVEHRIPKSKLKDDELFNIVSFISNDKYYVNDKRWASVAKSALDKNNPEVWFPSQPANEFSKKDIGKLVHEILSIEIELFTK